MPNLTLLSVVSYDYKYFEINYKLTSKLNDKKSFNWLVVQNKSYFDQGKIFKKNYLIKKIKKKNIKYIKGVDQKKRNIRKIVYKGQIYNLENDRSYYHAEGIKIGIKEIKTRYVLILDPDAFVIYKNWCQELIKHMQEKDLAMFGAPYHPIKDFESFRNFPTVYFLLIDLKKIKKKIINFSPPDKKQLNNQLNKIILPNYGFFNNLLRIYAFAIGKIFNDKERYRIGSIGDTSFELYNRLFKKKMNLELLKPVIKKKDFGFLKRILDIFFPDSLSYVPKKKNYFSKKGFSEFNLPDFHILECQEYMWNYRPFLVHLRGSIKSFDNNINLLKKKLNFIVNKLKKLD